MGESGLLRQGARCGNKAGIVNALRRVKRQYHA